MGKLSLGAKAFLWIVLLFSVARMDIAESRACRGFFADINLSQAQKLTEKTQLKIVNWNLLDFTIKPHLLEKGKIPTRESRILSDGNRIYSKSMEEILEYQRTFEKLDADIYVLQEVVVESLEYFVKNFLKDEYQVIHGEKRKGVQIAFLIRKTLDIDYEVESFDHLTWHNDLVLPARDIPIFEKDLPALYLRQRDSKGLSPSADPQMIILGTHFKSKKRSRRYNGDPESNHQRTVQTQAAAQIIKKISQHYDKKIPLMLAGDFNTDVPTAKEVEPLRFILKNSMQILNKSLDLENYTHTYNPSRDVIIKNQLDGQLVNESLSQKLVESYVYKFRESRVVVRIHGNTAKKLDYQEELHRNPSDHKPVVGIYDMTR